LCTTVQSRKAIVGRPEVSLVVLNVKVLGDLFWETHALENADVSPTAIDVGPQAGGVDLHDPLDHIFRLVGKDSLVIVLHGVKKVTPDKGRIDHAGHALMRHLLGVHPGKVTLEKSLHL
jgi:hypothetical protein